ncbi:MAG: High-affinity nickel transporter [Vicinamibacterales bacterium]
MLTVLTGALAGLFHVLSGPDHLAAVAPIAVADRRRGWIAGWTWGAGHASGVAVVAVLAVVFRDLLPPIDVISSWGERLVGVALIGIGLWALSRSMRIEHASHRHGHVAHEHLHVRRGPAWMQRLGHAHASFYMGILHGVAGSSHFFGVLPALALPTRGAALTYIAAFGVGSVAAMTLFAAAVGLAGTRVPNAAGAHRLMMRAAAMVALVVGGVWLVG